MVLQERYGFSGKTLLMSQAGYFRIDTRTARPGVSGVDAANRVKASDRWKRFALPLLAAPPGTGFDQFRASMGAVDGANGGTGFVIRDDERYWLVTALHVLKTGNAATGFDQRIERPLLAAWGSKNLGLILTDGRKIVLGRHAGGLMDAVLIELQLPERNLGVEPIGLGPIPGTSEMAQDAMSNPCWVLIGDERYEVECEEKLVAVGYPIAERNQYSPSIVRFTHAPTQGAEQPWCFGMLGDVDTGYSGCPVFRCSEAGLEFYGMAVSSGTVQLAFGFPHSIHGASAVKATLLLAAAKAPGDWNGIRVVDV